MRTRPVDLDSRPAFVPVAATPVHYLSAVGCMSVALLVRWLLDPQLGELQPLSLLFGAVALSVWLGGYKPALVAMVLGYLSADYLFTAPRGEIAIYTTQELISLITYLSSSLIVIGFGEALRRSTARAREYARELERHKVELERADRAKDQFLATLAHELRNPISAVSNIVQVLHRRAATHPQIKEACHILDRQTAHVKRLVDDLLDISRVRSGKIYLRKEAVQLSEVVRVAVDSIADSATAAGHRLHVEDVDTPLVVYGDFSRLTQVFSNLLSNAIRYTPQGGSVGVTLRRDGAHAVVVVKDSGIGIPAHMLERIFEMFEQSDRAVEHNQSGLGIGLALVRRLLAMHGGQVSASSLGQNQGSEFTVRLLLLTTAADQLAAGGAGQTGGSARRAQGDADGVSPDAVRPFSS